MVDHGVYGGEEAGCIGDEVVVVIYESEELGETTAGGGSSEVNDGLDLEGCNAQ